MGMRTYANDARDAGEGHAWLAALIDEAPLAIGFSRDGVMVDANPAYVRLFGYGSIAEIRGRSILEQIAQSHRAEIQGRVAKRARGEESQSRYRSRGVRRDGSEFPFEVTTTRVLTPDGALTIAFISDLSEHDEAVFAARASEERFRTLAAAAFEGVFIHEAGRIVLANEAGAAMYGYEPEEIIGRTVAELTARESQERTAAYQAAELTAHYEGFARRKDGSTFPVELHARSLEHQGKKTRVAVIRDVTERKRIEAEQRALAERVRHAQKLESLGMLAGGVAHDFNNILTIVTNRLALLRNDAKLGDAALGHIDTIANAVERAGELCRQMLAYAGKATLVSEAIELSALVADMSSMLELSISKKVTLARELATNLPMALGDPTQIRQVIMNLVINASEAIGEAAGTVRVSTGVSDLGAEAFARSAAGGDPKPGKYVYLRVDDDGIGMNAQTVAQMFDPFFTTKFVGRGLGMAAVLGIVRGHSGAIEVDSTPGKGTSIRVFFPVQAVEKSRKPSPAPARARGEGVVLVVDDEQAVRASTQLLLQELGFEAVLARDGVEALDILKDGRHHIDVVLLDATMPRMAGAETLQEIRKLAPRIPVVLASGYLTSGSESRSMYGTMADALLAKPYSVDELLESLNRAMRHGRT